LPDLRTSFLTVLLACSRSAVGRASIGFVAALVALASIVDTADAQRRRRRRRTTEPTETAEPAETTADPGAAGDDPVADPAAAPDAGPATTGTTGATTAATTGAPVTSASTTPAPASSPPAAALTPMGDPGPLPPDLGPLRSDWSTLMDDMVSARQRVATLGEELFRTRLAVTVQDRAGDDQLLTRFALELDGTPIFHTDSEIEGGDAGREVFSAALAPGPHVLTVELEQSARESAEYRYTQRDTFRFIVVRDRRTEITIVLEDDSDIARSFPGGGEGRYEIRTRLRVATRALE
jgi:hypothetical protein